MDSSTEHPAERADGHSARSATSTLTRPTVTPGIDRNSQLHALTGLRFLAAFMVFGFHAWQQNLFASPVAQGTFAAVFRYGGLIGVGFFFVLSGFVLTWSMRATDTPTAFWRRRLFKIFPNHLVTFVVAFLLLTAAQITITGQQAVLNALLLQAWSPQLLIATSVNSVSWSLSCELLFYLWFPWWMVYIERIRPERLWAWASVVFGAILLVPLVALALPDQPAIPGQTMSAWQLWFIYILPPVRMLDFVFGILLARIVLTGRPLPLGVGGATALTVGLYALTPVFPWGWRFTAVMVLPLGLLIASVAKADASGRRMWLAHPVMVWFGEVSFAFYLWHWLVLIFGAGLLGGRSYDTPTALAVVALLFAITLLLSWLLFRFVERPIMRRFATARPRSRTVQ